MKVKSELTPAETESTTGKKSWIENHEGDKATKARPEYL